MFQRDQKSNSSSYRNLSDRDLSDLNDELMRLRKENQNLKISLKQIFEKQLEIRKRGHREEDELINELLELIQILSTKYRWLKGPKTFSNGNGCDDKTDPFLRSLSPEAYREISNCANDDRLLSPPIESKIYSGSVKIDCTDKKSSGSPNGLSPSSPVKPRLQNTKPASKSSSGKSEATNPFFVNVNRENASDSQSNKRQECDQSCPDKVDCSDQENQISSPHIKKKNQLIKQSVNGTHSKNGEVLLRPSRNPKSNKETHSKSITNNTHQQENCYVVLDPKRRARSILASAIPLLPPSSGSAKEVLTHESIINRGYVPITSTVLTPVEYGQSYISSKFGSYSSMSKQRYIMKKIKQLSNIEKHSATKCIRVKLPQKENTSGETRQEKIKQENHNKSNYSDAHSDKGLTFLNTAELEVGPGSKEEGVQQENTFDQVDVTEKSGYMELQNGPKEFEIHSPMIEDRTPAVKLDKEFSARKESCSVDKTMLHTKDQLANTYGNVGRGEMERKEKSSQRTSNQQKSSSSSNASSPGISLTTFALNSDGKGIPGALYFALGTDTNDESNGFYIPKEKTVACVNAHVNQNSTMESKIDGRLANSTFVSLSEIADRKFTGAPVHRARTARAVSGSELSKRNLPDDKKCSQTKDQFHPPIYYSSASTTIKNSMKKAPHTMDNPLGYVSNTSKGAECFSTSVTLAETLCASPFRHQNFINNDVSKYLSTHGHSQQMCQNTCFDDYHDASPPDLRMIASRNIASAILNYEQSSASRLSPLKQEESFSLDLPKVRNDEADAKNHHHHHRLHHDTSH